MKRIWIPLLLAVVVSMIIGAGASGYAVPTLFHNDEAWYKDSVAPLLMKNGVYHIPADLLGMFGDITVSYHNNDDNLLLTRGDGTYASVLFSDRRAAINGDICENIGIFRENGYTYVDAEWIAGVFSLTCEYSSTADGQTVLRLKDSEAVRTMEELLEVYIPAAETEETQPPETTEPETTPETEIPPETLPETVIKRIYILSDDNYWRQGYVPAEDIAGSSGLVCTLFLHEGSADEKLWEYGFFRSAGICAGSVEEAEAVNRKLEERFYRRMEYVLPADENTDREALRQAGYIVIEPDFTVDAGVDPDVVYEALYAWMLENDTAVVRVGWDGCSQRMLALLCNLNANPDWCRVELLLP